MTSYYFKQFHLAGKHRHFEMLPLHSLFSFHGREGKQNNILKVLHKLNQNILEGSRIVIIKIKYYDTEPKSKCYPRVRFVCLFFIFIFIYLAA